VKICVERSPLRNQLPDQLADLHLIFAKDGVVEFPGNLCDAELKFDDLRFHADQQGKGLLKSKRKEKKKEEKRKEKKKKKKEKKKRNELMGKKRKKKRRKKKKRSLHPSLGGFDNFLPQIMDDFFLVLQQSLKLAQGTKNEL